MRRLHAQSAYQFIPKVSQVLPLQICQAMCHAETCLGLLALIKKRATLKHIKTLKWQQMGVTVRCPKKNLLTSFRIALEVLDTLMSEACRPVCVIPVLK